MQFHHLFQHLSNNIRMLPVSDYFRHLQNDRHLHCQLYQYVGDSGLRCHSLRLSRVLSFSKCMWYATCDMLHVICYIWYATYDMLHMICSISHGSKWLTLIARTRSLISFRGGASETGELFDTWVELRHQFQTFRVEIFAIVMDPSSSR